MGDKDVDMPDAFLPEQRPNILGQQDQLPLAQGEVAGPPEQQQGQQDQLPLPQGEVAGADTKARREKEYTATQIDLIKKGVEDGLGYSRIVKKYPGFGLTKSGVRDVVERFKKNGAVERKKGSGRKATART